MIICHSTCRKTLMIAGLSIMALTTTCLLICLVLVVSVHFTTLCFVNSTWFDKTLILRLRELFPVNLAASGCGSESSRNL